MAARANWKGVLKIGEVAYPVALFTPALAAERIAFHILNRKSGHRVHREYVDAETGERRLRHGSCSPRASVTRRSVRCARRRTSTMPGKRT